jgi:hypothetical protein
MAIPFRQGCGQLLDGGLLSFSMACSTEKEPASGARKLLRAYEMLSHDRLRRDEHESMLDEPAHVVTRLVLGPLERVRAQVEQHRQS